MYRIDFGLCTMHTFETCSVLDEITMNVSVQCTVKVGIMFWPNLEPVQCTVKVRVLFWP